MSANPASKRQSQEVLREQDGKRYGDGISKAVLRRVARHLENHFNFEIQENNFVTRPGSQKESIVLYNFPASKPYQRRDPGDAVPQLVKPKVKRSVKKSISSPYVRCLVRTTNEVVATYPMQKLEKLHTMPLDAKSSKGADPYHDVDDKETTQNHRQPQQKQRCRTESQQSPRRLQNYRRHVASMLEEQHYVDFYYRQGKSHQQSKPLSPPKMTKKECQRREAMRAAKKLIEEPKSSSNNGSDSRSSHSSVSKQQQQQKYQQEKSPSPEQQTKPNSHSEEATNDSQRPDSQSSTQPEVEVKIRVLGGDKPAAENEERHSDSGDSVAKLDSDAGRSASPAPRSRGSSVETGEPSRSSSRSSNRSLSSSSRSSNRSLSSSSSENSKSLTLTPSTSPSNSPVPSPKRSEPREQSSHYTPDDAVQEPVVTQSSSTAAESSPVKVLEAPVEAENLQSSSQQSAEATDDPMSGAAQSITIPQGHQSPPSETTRPNDVGNDAGGPDNDDSDESSSVGSYGSSSATPLSDSSDSSSIDGNASSDTESDSRSGRRLPKN